MKSLRWALFQTSGILIKQGNLKTVNSHQENTTWRWRNQSDVATCQDMPKSARKPLRASKETGRRFSFTDLRWHKPANPWVSDIQPPELRDHKGLWFKSPGLWYCQPISSDAECTDMEGQVWDLRTSSNFGIMEAPKINPLQILKGNCTLSEQS